MQKYITSLKFFLFFLIPFFAGCGDKKASHDEIVAIASMSEDADTHLELFTKSIQALSEKSECSIDAMQNYGGFMKVAYSSEKYFIYCNEPNNSKNRWYLDTDKGLSKVK